jgi:asparagine synthase (glutamine-hydrolysing)
MCGLTGFWDFTSQFNREKLTTIAVNMADKISHRGPDDYGAWVDENIGLAMAHRRLTIIDLTTAGSQPMHSASNRFVIIYNGEVYNAPQLQQELVKLGHKFIGHSDTAVILAAFEQWGIKAAVSKFIGMFAFAVWDRQLSELSLIRDRLGVKPLYYGVLGKTLFFGSQLKSFWVNPLWRGEIDVTSVQKYISLNYVPTPYSIFKDIYKLEPATILTINQQQKITKYKYWDLNQLTQDRQYVYSESDAINNLHDLLQDSIKIRQIADVPLGAFLSGGIDSSLVVALMQSMSSTAVNTFTIGFNEQSYNEAEFASKVAKHLGTNHREFILEPKQALDLIATLPEVYDEPFADSSQIPTLLVSRLARENVTVALSGDGGDELFAGYNRYYLADNFIGKIAWLPKEVRSLLAKAICAVSVKNWGHLNKIFKVNNLGDKLYKLANILPFNSPEEFYTTVISFWGNNNPMLAPEYRSKNIYLREQPFAKNINNFVEYMQFLDQYNYLPDDILTKLDRASMAYGLEAREPLLDHRIVEFAWNLPMEFKISGNNQKWILKQILHKYLPMHLIERPKMGFGVPIGEWLRGDLRAWATDLLDRSKITNQGLFDANIVGNRLQQHLSGARNYQYDLWGILMFQAWYDEYARYTRTK